jgi:hypothetical protein
MALRGFIGVGSGRIQNDAILSRVGESRFFEAPYKHKERPLNFSYPEKYTTSKVKLRNAFCFQGEDRAISHLICR